MQLCAKARIVEHEPALVDDQQSRPSVEQTLDTMKQVRKHGRGGTRSDQPFGLECLDIRCAKALGFGIEQPTPGATDTVRL